MATALNEAVRPEASAKVRFQVDGNVAVSTATHELGTGMYTILAMIAADRLGLPVEKIRPELGDSTLPAAPGSFAAQSTGSVGPAVVNAADVAVTRLIQFAVTEPQSPFLGLKSEEVTYSAGVLHSKGIEVAFSSLLQKAGRFSVEGNATARPGDESSKYVFYSFGATFCEVRVNLWTAETRVSRINSVMDIGKVINPKTAKSQIVGGIIMGIGMALLEETYLDDKIGRFTNANLADYHIATHADMPRIAVEFIDKPDLVFNPLGARGAGEIGITGVAASIANAVYNATGKRIKHLPITPDKLLS
jgi:xanthine dehydrogenase YagR molybdenum-binding subunit